MKRGASLAERFENYTIPEPNSGCLLWLGAVRPDGYGRMRISGKGVAATHVALKLAGKQIPGGMCALHRCDNPFCVNADHLFLGTRKDNNADMFAKGRHNLVGLTPGGAPAGHNRVSDEERQPARDLFNKGFSLSAISRATGRPVQTIFRWVCEWKYGRPYKKERK